MRDSVAMHAFDDGELDERMKSTVNNVRGGQSSSCQEPGQGEAYLDVRPSLWGMEALLRNG